MCIRLACSKLSGKWSKLRRFFPRELRWSWTFGVLCIFSIISLTFIALFYWGRFLKFFGQIYWICLNFISQVESKSINWTHKKYRIPFNPSQIKTTIEFFRFRTLFWIMLVNALCATSFAFWIFGREWCNVFLSSLHVYWKCFNASKAKATYGDDDGNGDVFVHIVEMMEFFDSYSISSKYYLDSYLMQECVVLFHFSVLWMIKTHTHTLSLSLSLTQAPCSSLPFSLSHTC